MSDSVPEAEVPPQAAAVEPAQEMPEPEPVADHDPAAPSPLNVPRVPTGNAEADALLGRLADADHLATDGHVEVYEDVHRGLRDALTALDARQGPPVPSSPAAPTSSYEPRS
ncbi:MAG: hypothetical protein QOC85_1937 [Streptomyces sp.]|jgi:hypothetical protein|nr:hypothetical protein [Streptomyces sp.]